MRERVQVNKNVANMVREKDRDREEAKEINRLIDSCVETNKQIENRQIYNSANRTNKQSEK